MNSEMSENRSMTESQKPPNALTASSSTRDLAVDEVEDVGDHHDDAGGDELAQRQRPGGRDIDEHADERQRIGMDAQPDAGVDDQPQREHADAADEPGESHDSAVVSACAVPARRRSATL